MDSEHCIRTGILTVSDRCSKGEAEDTSGGNLERMVNSKTLINGVVVARQCVPDDIEDIKRTLLNWSDVEKVDLILTTGGTGFSARDVTPEATRAVIMKEAPGITIAIIQKSLSITPMAMLSRLVCGIRYQTLIVNLPGSRKGAQECFEFASLAIPHAVDQLQERRMKTDKLHSSLSVSGSPTSVSHGCQCTVEGSLSTTVASRPRHSPYPLISVPEAQAIVLEQCSETDVELVPLQASDGDGLREVVDAVPAGSNPLHHVKPGQCARISTGAPVPDPCDAVVQVEDTELVRASEDGSQEFEVNIITAPVVGQDIRPVGSDIERGQHVLAQRTKLSPSDLGVLATIGASVVTVYRLPRVAVLSTGNEIVAPGSALKLGQIRDSNKTTLITLLEKNGFPAHDAGIACDEFDDHVKKLRAAFEKADVVVSSGGVSMGEKDLLKAVLVKEFSAIIHFGRVLMKPGKPTAFASLKYGDKLKLVFGLPGNPVSAAVTCQLYVLPALRKMSGHATVHPTSLKAKLAEDIVLDPRPEYHRAVLSWSEDCALPMARSTGNQISSRLLSFQGANALLMLPPATAQTKALLAGTVVTALVTDMI
ncbi:gephyrin isoform X3 [Dermacentor andersoni]|uniref:gephyrin isoform X3 n=1 Tax=Dermacentor andersoni TaxID=34620 RepID=UPI002416F2E0|nr:gephyrin-like isoform X3 [Dermacentor andersoni]